MRFLIVGVSLLFSFIFYIFYTANLGKNIFFQNNENIFYGKTILWSFIYFPIIFLIFAICFFFIFKGHKIKYGPVHTDLNKNIYGSIIIWLCIYIIFYLLEYNFIYLFIIYTLGILCHFIVKKLFYSHKIEKNTYVNGNIFSIIISYFFTLSLFIYIFFFENFSLYSSLSSTWIYLWLLLSSLFHIYIHIRYNNIISFFMWVITCIFSLYSIIHILFPWII